MIFAKAVLSLSAVCLLLPTVDCTFEHDIQYSDQEIRLILGIYNFSAPEIETEQEWKGVIQRTPHIRQLTKYLITITDEVKIPCTARGRPEPKISLEWCKNIYETGLCEEWKVVRRRYKNGAFIVKEPGKYRCVAENEYGRAISYEYSVQSLIEKLEGVRSVKELKTESTLHNKSVGRYVVLDCGRVLDKGNVSHYYEFTWATLAMKDSKYINTEDLQGSNIENEMNQVEVADDVKNSMIVDPMTGKLVLEAKKAVTLNKPSEPVYVVCRMWSEKGHVAYLPPVYRFPKYANFTRHGKKGGVVYQTGRQVSFPVSPYFIKPPSIMCVIHGSTVWTVTLNEKSFQLNPKTASENGLYIKSGKQKDRDQTRSRSDQSKIRLILFSSRNHSYDGTYKCENPGKSSEYGLMHVAMKPFPSWRDSKKAEPHIVKTPEGIEVKCDMEHTDPENNIVWRVNGKRLFVKVQEKGKVLRIGAHDTHRHGSVSCIGRRQDSIGELRGWKSVVPQNVTLNITKVRFWDSSIERSYNVSINVTFDKYFTQRLEVEWQYISKYKANKTIGICNITGDELNKGWIINRTMIVTVRPRLRHAIHRFCNGTVSKPIRLRGYLKRYRVVVKSFSHLANFSMSIVDVEWRIRPYYAKMWWFVVGGGGLLLIIILVVLIIWCVKRKKNKSGSYEKGRTSEPAQ